MLVVAEATRVVEAVTAAVGSEEWDISLLFSQSSSCSSCGSSSTGDVDGGGGDGGSSYITRYRRSGRRRSSSSSSSSKSNNRSSDSSCSSSSIRRRRRSRSNGGGPDFAKKHAVIRLESLVFQRWVLIWEDPHCRMLPRLQVVSVHLGIASCYHVPNSRRHFSVQFSQHERHQSALTQLCSSLSLWGTQRTQHFLMLR